jgi:hypothetical protein
VVAGGQEGFPKPMVWPLSFIADWSEFNHRECPDLRLPALLASCHTSVIMALDRDNYGAAIVLTSIKEV